MGLIVIVTGWRNWQDGDHVDDVLDTVRPDMLVEGGAGGADRLARHWAGRNGVWVVEVPALWDSHGRQAGPNRNRWMLKLARTLSTATGYRLEAHAFPGATSTGTHHMVSLCEDAGVPVFTHHPREVTP
jgi:hypothetical protein